MKLNYKRTIFIGFAFMAISSFWQMYDTIIPLILKYTFSLGETMSGIIMAADNVLALFLLPVFGVWSDRCTSKYGRRSPFIYVGTILSVIFLILLSVADAPGKLPLFVGLLLMLLLSMNLYRSPAVALMPDLTPPPLRSKGNAVINLMGAVGFIYALVMVKIFGGKAEERPSYLALFITIAALMILSLIVLALTIRENRMLEAVKKECADYGISMSPENTADKPEDRAKKSSLPAPVKKSLIMILLSVALWYIAYNAVTTAFSRYATEVWKLDSDYVNCLLIASVAAVISYFPIGILSEKLGRKKVILIGVIAMFLSYASLFCYTSYHFTAVCFFALIGFGWAAINVNSLPMVVDMCEAADVGKFTGYYYTFSMTAQVITPIASGALLEYVSYRTLFPYSAFFMLCAFVTMQFVRHGDCKPGEKKSFLEHFDVGD